MANPYYFSTEDGDQYIPVTDAEHIITGMSASYTTGQCYLQFYSASKTPVTPDAGTITFDSGAFDGQWLGASVGSTSIDATTVIAGAATYTVPKFDGCVVNSKMVLSGITGATYVRAYHWRAK